MGWSEQNVGAAWWLEIEVTRSDQGAGPHGQSWHDDLWSGWAMTQQGVRPRGVVVAPPLLDQELGLGERVDQLDVERLGPREPSR